LYAGLSTGPHYVSDAPRRQAPGFLFSDNLIAGLNYAASKVLVLDFRFGARHISNANFKEPNGGVNNLILQFGLKFNLLAALPE
jgi:hypothetical protein